jgi:hypothetical protein
VAEAGIVGQVLRVGDEGDRHPPMTVTGIARLPTLWDV